MFTEAQQAYLNDPLFAATVQALINAVGRDQRDEVTLERFVEILGAYQMALRKDNERLKTEVIRLTMRSVEPFTILPRVLDKG